MREHYLEDGGKSRFTHYLSSRFGGSRNSATDIARTALVMDYDPTIDGGRLWLIKSTSGTAFFMPPATLPADKLTEFCQGFADVLVSRAALESA